MFNIIAPAFSELVRHTKKYRVMNDGYPPCMAPEDEEDDDEE
jgi:hypothetical protein